MSTLMRSKTESNKVIYTMKLMSKKTLAVAGIAGTLLAMSACSTTPTTETTAKPTGVGKAQAVQSVDLNRYAEK